MSTHQVVTTRKLWFVSQEPKRGRAETIYKSTVVIVIVEAETKAQAIALADIDHHHEIRGEFKKVNAVPLQLNARYIL